MENNTTLQLMVDAADLFAYLYKRGALDFTFSGEEGIHLGASAFFRYFPEGEIVRDEKKNRAAAYYAGQRFFCVLPEPEGAAVNA